MCYFSYSVDLSSSIDPDTSSEDAISPDFPQDQDLLFHPVLLSIDTQSSITDMDVILDNSPVFLTHPSPFSFRTSGNPDYPLHMLSVDENVQTVDTQNQTNTISEYPIRSTRK